MPQQEVFLEMSAGERALSVVKTYDRSFARERFRELDLAALKGLVAALRLDEQFEPSNTPTDSDEDFRDFVWDEIVEAAREDGNVLSFFLTIERTLEPRRERCLCVAPDWPTAQAYADRRLEELHSLA